MKIENDSIAEIEYTAPSIDVEDCYVIPGLIDIHFHGCMGNDFCDGTWDSLEAIARQEATWGITGICPASMTLPPEKLSSIMQNAYDYYLLQHTFRNSKANLASQKITYDSGPCPNNVLELTYNDSKNDNRLRCADFLGIHMEGPFLSLSKKGAQKAEYLSKPDIACFQQLQKISGELIKLVDVAPEEEGAFDFIRQVSGSCVVSLAHTAADYHTCMKAFQSGASHVTHLFNAMNPFSHREPGLVGAAFDTPCCDVELICDGIHLSPAAVRMAFQLFTEERIILISDSMMATGMTDGTYTLGEQFVTVQGSLATLAENTTVGSDTLKPSYLPTDSVCLATGSTIAGSNPPATGSTIASSNPPATGSTIAGSVTHLADCVRKAVSFGIPLESAIRCATANPARSIGCDDQYGYLKPGYAANVVVLNSDLSLRNIILHGQQIV